MAAVAVLAEEKDFRLQILDFRFQTSDFRLMRTLLHILLLAVNAVVVAALLLAAFAGYVSPTISIVPSLLGLGFEWIVLVNILMCIVWLLTSKRRYVLVSGIALLITVIPIKRTFNLTSHHSEQITQSHHIKVLTYNTLRLGKRRPADQNDVLQYIKNSKADIVFLQEYEESCNNKFLQKEAITRTLADYPYHFTQFRINDKTRRFGVAIFSKYKLYNFKNIDYESTYNGAFSCDALVGDDILHLVCVHLESNQLTGKELDQPVEDAKNNSSDVTASTKNIIDKMRKAYALRLIQADIIAKDVLQSKHKTILCGDFNDVPVSYTYHRISKHLHDAFAEAGPRGFGHTFKRKWLHVRIDYILHSDNMKAYNLHVDKNDGSDHFPVSCIIAWE